MMLLLGEIGSEGNDLIPRTRLHFTNRYMYS